MSLPKRDVFANFQDDKKPNNKKTVGRRVPLLDLFRPVYLFK
jgi:hypothetical protein